MHHHVHDISILHLSPAITLYILALTALLGLVMGSFLNCFAWRYSKGESVLRGRSHCADCGHPLAWYELIPLLSWLIQRGTCRHCGKKISARYLLTEVACAAVYLTLVWHYDLTFEVFKYIILFTLLFAAAVTDLYCSLIPDRLIVVGTCAALVFALLSPNGALAGVAETLVGGFSVSLPLLLLVLLYERLTKKEAMGGGDIKLMFLIGLYFPWQLNLLILIFACILGIFFSLLVASRQSENHPQGAFPFGPSLCVAAWIVALCGESLLSWYLGLFHL